MRVAIICEYNPFHNGHKYQIDYIKKENPNAEIICFMSGDFCQRGIPAITSKFNRARVAVENGADLVVELNQLECIQAAHIFAETAVSMFSKFNITHICFGSESNDVEKILSTEIKIEKDNSMAASIDLKPNDRLGFFYLKSIKEHNLNIEPIIIKRTNDYNESIDSATKIREAIKNNDYNYKSFTPMIIDGDNYIERYFDLIKYKLLQTDTDELSSIHMIDNGIENWLVKNIKSSTNFNEFIEKSTSKVFTKSRIYRSVLFILLNIKEVNKMDKWRLLASSNGLIQKELKEYIYTGGPNALEQKIMNLYCHGTTDDKYKDITLKGIPFVI